MMNVPISQLYYSYEIECNVVARLVFNRVHLVQPRIALEIFLYLLQ